MFIKNSRVCIVENSSLQHYSQFGTVITETCERYKMLLDSDRDRHYKNRKLNCGQKLTLARWFGKNQLCALKEEKAILEVKEVNAIL